MMPAPPRLHRMLRRLPALGLAAALSACAMAPLDGSAPAPATGATPAAPQVPPPAARPETVTDAARRLTEAEMAEAETRATAAAATPQSRNMAQYYATVQAALLARGKMRVDPGSMAEITPEILTRNFIQIALRDEYVRQGAALVAQSHDAPLRRWQAPVRMQMVWGDSSGPAARRARGTEIAAYARRLGAIAHHPVSLSEQPGNFVVMVLSEDERRAIAPELATLVPGIPAEDMASIRNLAPQNYCTVFAYSNGASPAYIRAVAVLRTELPDQLFTSCVHEELAQGLGLTNDSPQVRPSIFNDDEDFARLTQQDELLLRILYDKRLRPGMTEDEATPIVRAIAAELLGAPTS